jgi:hypothetical protein
LGALLTRKKSPSAVPYTPVNKIDAQAEQEKAISGNLGMESDLEKLLSRSNRFQQGQANDLLEMAVPGYGKLSSSILKMGQSAADNPYDLPTDVTKNLTRLAAERGVKVGSRGETQSFSALRDLGVNMLDYGQQRFTQALQALTTATGIAPRISPMSPLSFYVTPANQLGTAVTNAQIEQGNNNAAQGIRQGERNAATAANNFNTQNVWDSVLRGVGTVWGARS